MERTVEVIHVSLKVKVGFWSAVIGLALFPTRISASCSQTAQCSLAVLLESRLLNTQLQSVALFDFILDDSIPAFKSGFRPK